MIRYKVTERIKLVSNVGFKFSIKLCGNMKYSIKMKSIYKFYTTCNYNFLKHEMSCWPKKRSLRKHSINDWQLVSYYDLKKFESNYCLFNPSSLGFLIKPRSLPSSLHILFSLYKVVDKRFKETDIWNFWISAKLESLLQRCHVITLIKSLVNDYKFYLISIFY